MGINSTSPRRVFRPCDRLREPQGCHSLPAHAAAAVAIKRAPDIAAFLLRYIRNMSARFCNDITDSCREEPYIWLEKYPSYYSPAVEYPPSDAPGCITDYTPDKPCFRTKNTPVLISKTETARLIGNTELLHTLAIHVSDGASFFKRNVPFLYSPFKKRRLRKYV